MVWLSLLFCVLEKNILAKFRGQLWALKMLDDQAVLRSFPICFISNNNHETNFLRMMETSQMLQWERMGTNPISLPEL